MTITDLSIDYARIAGGGRFLESPSLPFRERIALNLGVDFTDWLYMRHKIHGATTKKQFHWVGWQFDIGTRPFKWLELGFRHHSQHTLDGPSPGYRFPVEDSIFVRLNVLGEKCTKK